MPVYEKITLGEKCPNTDFFLVHISLYLDYIRKFAEYISVFSSNTGKYGTEKTPYLDTFHAVINFEPIGFVSLYIFLYDKLLKEGPRLVKWLSVRLRTKWL